MSISDPLDNLESIWYHSEPSDVPYCPNQFLGWDFFYRFLQRDGSSAAFLTQQVYCRAFIRVFDWKENQLIHPLSLLSKISFLFPQIRQYLAKLFFICFEFYTIPILIVGQELLKLLWTVYSEEKLQSCLKLTKFQNLFIRISQQVYQKYHAQKRPKICTCCSHTTYRKNNNLEKCMGMGLNGFHIK